MVINKTRILNLALSLAVLTFIYFILYKLYIPRIASFGCFDDCLSISAGYFINEGKQIYTDVFYNHQLFMPYLSSLIQTFFNPQSVFELLLRHRQIILFLSFIFNVILILRFGHIAFLFAIFYETSKFYFFGDRFLAEGLVVYPLVYMALLFFGKLKKIPVKKFDFVAIGFFTWFVLFAREPYVPLALFLYVILLFGKDNLRPKLVSILIVFLMSIATLSLVNLSDMFYSLYTFNQQTIIKSEYSESGLTGLGILKIFFYPFIVFVEGKINFLRFYLIGTVSILFVSMIYYFYKTKDIKLPVFIFAILGFSAVRFVTPGQVFYEAYRQLIWHGLLIVSILYLFFFMKDKYKKVSAILLTAFILCWIFLLANKNSYIFGNSDPHFLLITNYGRYIQVGEAVKTLSKAKDTLFVEAAEELMYVSSKSKSSYKYSMYTSFMPMFEKYTKAREEMFEKNPPDFYYDFCKDAKIPTYRLEEKFRTNYHQLSEDGKPSCLFIHKGKLKELSPEKIDKLREWRFSL